jgi:hypothetical protein
MIIVGGCKQQDAKPEPSGGSATMAAAGSAAAPVSNAAHDPPAGSAAPSPSTGSAAVAGNGGGSSAGGACEDYYQSELKFFEDEHVKASGKHDEFIAGCLKLPSDLQQCQGDLHYAMDHDDACTKLLQQHQKEVMALRALGIGK